jgi:hypothetical protein
LLELKIIAHGLVADVGHSRRHATNISIVNLESEHLAPLLGVWADDSAIGGDLTDIGCVIILICDEYGQSCCAGHGGITWRERRKYNDNCWKIIYNKTQVQ